MEKIYSEGLSVKDSCKLFLWLVFFRLLLGIPFYILGRMLAEVSSWSHYVEILGEIAVWIILLRHISRRRGFKIEVLDFPPKSAYIIIAVFMLGVRLVFDNTIYILFFKMPMGQWLVEALEGFSSHSPTMVITVCLVAPIFEEIVFRGIFLRQLLKRHGSVVALILSAVFFALMHFILGQIINAFVLGIVLGIIYLKTGSLFLSIFAHFVNNFYVLLVYFNWLPFEIRAVFSLYEFLAGTLFLALGLISLLKLKNKPVFDIKANF